MTHQSDKNPWQNIVMLRSLFLAQLKWSWIMNHHYIIIFNFNLGLAFEEILSYFLSSLNQPETSCNVSSSVWGTVIWSLLCITEAQVADRRLNSMRLRNTRQTMWKKWIADFHSSKVKQGVIKRYGYSPSSHRSTYCTIVQAQNHSLNPHPTSNLKGIFTTVMVPKYFMKSLHSM